MIHVHSQGTYVAMIVRQDKRADGYRKEEPWMLLHVSGRIDRFESQAEARAEAHKAWPAAKMTKG
jgi:hypothetical protein